MIEVYTGFDPREEVGTHVFHSSVMEHCSEPVTFTPLHKPQIERMLGDKFRSGTNAFTVTRFLIPALRDWRVGDLVIFADGADMLCLGDLAELKQYVNPSCAVQVVKHDYKTRHPRKYVGTSMEADNRDYKKKNWASLMVINCGHYAWRKLTPDKVAGMKMIDLLQFNFLRENEIGSLPPEWNWLCDEYGENPKAKLLHWTAGVPGFPNYADAPHARDWEKQLQRVNYACS